MVTGVRLLVTLNSEVVDYQNLCLDSITMVFSPTGRTQSPITTRDLTAPWPLFFVFC